MTTKNSFLHLKDKHKTIIDIDDRYYSNLNLNQNIKCSNISSKIQSNSKLNNNKNCDSTTIFESYEEKKKSSITTFCFKYRNSETFKDDNKKPWKKDDSSTIPNKNSTLSLHISAFENSSEASFDFLNKSLEKSWLIQKQKQINHVSTLVFKNSFEFPRQQSDRTTDPEVSQYKASQKLLNANNSHSNSMDEHEKCHYEAFFKCQRLFLHHRTLSTFGERCYMCETCNKPFARLQIAFVKLMEAIHTTISEKHKIPTKNDFDQIKKYFKNSYYSVSVNEAKAVLKKGQQVLQRGLKTAKDCDVLSPKNDGILMKQFHQNESRILQYPIIYHKRVPYPKEIINAYTKYFRIKFERKKSAMPLMSAAINDAFIHENDKDSFILTKKHPPIFEEYFVNLQEESKEIVPYASRISILDEVEKEWMEEYNFLN